MSTDTPDTEPERFFEEAGGLHTEADLYSIYGTSPVRVERSRGKVRLEVSVSAGEVAAVLEDATARQLGEALIEAADSIE